MQKVPFTEAGLQELTTWLYSLPDAELQLEAYAIRTDLKKWALAHFELDLKQVAYLEKINENVIRFLEDQGSFAVGNRLPITLVKKETNTQTSGDDQGKYFESKSNLSATSDPEGAFVAGGDLVIEVTYKI